MARRCSPGRRSTGRTSSCRGCCGARFCEVRFRTEKSCASIVEKAKKHPGVKAVIAAQDVPSRRYGYAIEDEHIFAIDKVHYVGQPVAAVAAIDEDTAEEALSLIEVEYEELPAVFDR